MLRENYLRYLHTHEPSPHETHDFYRLLLLFSSSVPDITTRLKEQSIISPNYTKRLNIFQIKVKQISK